MYVARFSGKLPTSEATELERQLRHAQFRVQSCWACDILSIGEQEANIWPRNQRSNGLTRRGIRSVAVPRSVQGANIAMHKSLPSGFAACQVIRTSRALICALCLRSWKNH